MTPRLVTYELLLLLSVGCGSDSSSSTPSPTPEPASASAPTPTPEAAPNPWPGYHLALTLGRSGDGPGELRTPMGLDVNARAEIAVADAGNARVELLDAEGQRLWSYFGDGETALGRPMDVAFAPDGSLWVADFERDALIHLDAHGELLDRRTGEDAPKSPAGMLVLPDGRLVVSSFYDHTLRVYGAGATRTFGSEGEGAGQFHYPTGLTRDDTGRLWVADSYNHRVQRFSANFAPEASLRGSDGDALEVPVGVASLGGALHVADSAHHRVVALDPESGRVLSEWRVPSERDVHTPSRIVAAGDRLYVTDPSGDHIYVLEKAP